MKRKISLGAALCLFASNAPATQLEVGASLSGFQCYHTDPIRLHLTKEDVWSGRGSPSVFDEPNAGSRKLGVDPGLVYVAWPLKRANGFVQIIRVDGEIGWIAEDVIRPLYKEPGSKGGCTLSWSRTGLIQSHLDPGAKAWFWPNGRDMPNDMSR
jgi:hypothetical protein